jgi:mRNA interferase MazF
MVSDSYKRGDIVLCDFDPVLGHEQKGKRPAVVISENSYNKLSGMAVVLPVTSRKAKYAFELDIEDIKGETVGTIILDHIRSIDVRARKPALIGKVSADNLAHIKAKLQALLLQD